MTDIELVKKVWNYLYLGEKIEKCDCIMGCGCHDLHVAERCAELYNMGYADIIIFSGGVGKVTKNILNVTEAEKFAEIAIKLGVPKEKIYLEKTSTNTEDNFRNVKKLVEDENLNIDSFLIVHKPYMERRAYGAFQKYIPNKKCFVTSPNISFNSYIEEYTKKGKLEELINLIVSDLQRLIIYPKKGWQIKHSIPKEVLNAYNKLVKLGYDKYIIYE